MFSFPKMSKFSKLFENAFKTFDKGFDELDQSFDQLDEELTKQREQLDRENSTLGRMGAGESKETVQEEHRPDGTVIITRTIIRKSS